MTGSNPNVCYEVGYAKALNKPLILITGGRFRDIPSDLRSNRHISYDKTSKDWELHLASSIGENLNEIVGKRRTKNFDFVNDIHKKYHEIGIDLAEIID